MKLNDEAEAEIKRLTEWAESGLPLPEIYIRAAMVWAWAHSYLTPALCDLMSEEYWAQIGTERSAKECAEIVRERLERKP